MKRALAKLLFLWTVVLCLGLLTAGNSRAALADLRNLDSYVLFALDELDFKGGDGVDTGFINGGNVGVNNAGPPAGAADANLAIGVAVPGGKFIMSDNTHVVADYMRIGASANVYDVFYNVKVGTATPTIRNTLTVTIPDWNGGPLIDTQSILDRFPFDPDRTLTDGLSDTINPQNTTLNLTPGVYGLVRSRDGSTLNLSAGLYDMRQLVLGQNVTVNMTDQTILQIDDDVGLNGADFGTNTTGLAQIYIGAGSGANSQFGEGGEIWGQFFSLGNLRLGRAHNLYGRFWAQQIGSDFNVNVNFVPIPGAVWLLGSGLIGLIAIRRRLKS